MARDFYDPYTMRVKEIPELVEELNKVIMPKLPGGRERGTVWGVLCEAARIYSFADGVITEEEAKSDSFVWKAHGEHYAAATVIRKIADGMGVDNFKLREVPLERPEQPVLREVPVVPMPDGDPSGDGGDPSPATEAA